MTLAPAQARRLHKLLDALEAFAIDRYGLRASAGATMFASDDAADQLGYEALSKFWDDPSSIDAFLAEYSGRLTPSEVADLRGFSDRVCGTALMVGTDSSGRALVSVDLRTVAVVGITTPIAELIPGPYPKPIDIGLLPFDGVVTYDGYASEFPIEMGPGLRIALKAEMDDALKRAPITGAAEFAETARAIARERREQDEQRFAEQLKRDEWETKGNEPLPPGVHRGVLAGCTEEEREALIRKDIDENRHKMGKTGTPRFDYAAQFKKQAAKGEPQSRLIDALATENKAMLCRHAELLGLHNYSKLRKQELVELLAPELLRDTVLMEEDLMACGKGAFEATKDLVESGTLRFAADEAVSSARCRAVEPWTRLYWNKDEFILAMPEEVRKLAAGVDFDAIAVRREMTGCVEHLAETLTELSGVVSLPDFCERYWELYGTGASADDICRELTCLAKMYGDLGFSFWSDPKEPRDTRDIYIIDYTLSNQFVANSYARELIDAKGPEGAQAALKGNAPAPIEKKFAAELEKRDRTVRFLIDCHAKVAASDGKVKLDPVLKDMDVMKWKRSLPAAINLRNWLDAHVPEGENDLYFAENVLDELMDLRVSVASPTEFLRVVSDMDLFLLTEDPDSIISRVMAFWNGMPDWDRDGWSPDALADKNSGKKTFRNADGTPMKVGRNDPCPCGSGKKYKRCCGR